MITGINHITIAVSNLDTSFEFYVELLGMKPHARWNSGAYLSLGGVWFCLSCDNAKPSQDYTHLALDVTQQGYETVKTKLLEAGIKAWKDNKSEGDSFYFSDPDGHKLELHVGDLQSRLAHIKSAAYDGLELFNSHESNANKG